MRLTISGEEIEAIREEGRREVLREIAACTDDPRIETDTRYECIFCGLGDEEPHRPTCLWLQAQAVKDAE